jgi:hypothetical protein
MRDITTTDWDRAHNPYLMEYAESMKGARDRFNTTLYYKRRDCIRKYGFAIPTYEAITAIDGCTIDPYADNVIEIGAGSGYWTALLKTFSKRVRAFDPTPGGSVRSPYSFWKAWTDVEKADHTVLTRLPEAKSAVLLMVWPDYDVDWPAQALEAFSGNVLAYVGEGWSGCTGNERFHQILHDQWNEMSDISLPQWPGIHDSLVIYRRKTETERL